jgi:asparagine synthase (glutamine-hydrolysing)
MSVSVENRSPYLDTELFDWCQSIPTSHLVRDGRAKAVLRDAVRGIAPDAVIDNPRKVGFNAPILDYLDVSSNSVRDELLADSPVFDLIRRDRISELVGQRDLPNSRSKFLFNFVSAKLFLEEFPS